MSTALAHLTRSAQDVTVKRAEGAATHAERATVLSQAAWQRGSPSGREPARL
ncbi:MAG: hypothetical protein JXA21_01165 [Anaerolineae bacterium]|nr:hypothetical protein [Anaerolineae bacterium]